MTSDSQAILRSESGDLAYVAKMDIGERRSILQGAFVLHARKGQSNVASLLIIPSCKNVTARVSYVAAS